MIITKKILNDMAYKVVGCAIEVHRQLGPGLLESVYETCYVQELIDNNFSIKRQVPIPIVYKGKDLGTTLILDLLINDLIVVELKAVEIMIHVYKAQILSYLKLKRLIN